MKYRCNDYNEDNIIYRECVFIDKNTFDIEVADDSIIDLDDVPEDKFICDILIAPLISKMNKKGYKTMFCCQGHLDEFKDEDGEVYRSCIPLYIMFEAGDNLDKYIDYLFKLPRQFDVRIDRRMTETYEKEIEVTYNNPEKICPENKRISIYSSLPYMYSDEIDDIDPDSISIEEFNNYNNKDLKHLTDWVNDLPDLIKI